VKKWLDENGKAGSKECKGMVDTSERHLRISVLEGELVIDESDSFNEDKDSDQGFGRGKTTKTADCEYDVEYVIAEFEMKKAHIKFAGDSFAGKTTDFTFQIIEDGEAGENMTTCATKDGAVAGKRVGD
jgi:hypothetical protein